MFHSVKCNYEGIKKHDRLFFCCSFNLINVFFLVTVAGSLGRFFSPESVTSMVLLQDLYGHQPGKHYKKDRIKNKTKKQAGYCLTDHAIFKTTTTTKYSLNANTRHSQCKQSGT